MKRIFLSLLLVPVLTLMAQDSPLDILTGRISSSAVSLSYTYNVTRGNVDMSGEGTIEVQGKAFHLSLDGMEVFCDGSSQWTVDRTSHEVVIETLDCTPDSIYGNPAILLGSLGEAFKSRGEQKDSFRGMAVRRIDMVPAIAHTGLESVSLYFTEGKTPELAGVSAVAGDSSVSVFEILSMEWSQQGDPAGFSFDESSLDSSWVVTDLR